MALNSLYRGLGMHSDAYADIEECYSRNENPSDDRISVKLRVSGC